MPRVKGQGVITMHSEYPDENVNSCLEIIPKKINSKTVRFAKAANQINMNNDAKPTKYVSLQAVENYYQYKEFIPYEDLEKTDKKCRNMVKTERKLIKRINNLRINEDYINLRKRELFYKKWHDKVYSPLRKNIEKVLDKRYDKTLLQRKEMYSDFLNHCNRKGNTYLNIVTEDYNPFRHRTHSGKLNPNLISPLRSNFDGAENFTLSKVKTHEFKNMNKQPKRLLSQDPYKYLKTSKGGRKLSYFVSV